MRQKISLLAAAAVLLIGGAAQAAPGFGASSHRLGGGSAASTQSKPASLLEATLRLFGFETAATVQPVVGDRLGDTAGRTKECDQADKAEVAKAETKTAQGGAEAKARPRPNEPVYLAF
ncbi:MAG TPA: hypothetical protein PKH09_05000 [Parvularculaceae bacterium]|nr:hypothetical protein [Parvularculaceae bacterium]